MFCAYIQVSQVQSIQLEKIQKHKLKTLNSIWSILRFLFVKKNEQTCGWRLIPNQETFGLYVSDSTCELNTDVLANGNRIHWIAFWESRKQTFYHAADNPSGLNGCQFIKTNFWLYGQLFKFDNYLFWMTFWSLDLYYFYIRKTIDINNKIKHKKFKIA